MATTSLRTHTLAANETSDARSVDSGGTYVDAYNAIYSSSIKQGSKRLAQIVTNALNVHLELNASCSRT